jgi:hypothetical protein
MERIDLKRVTVRPVVGAERARWDALMRAHHYLGFDRTAGRALRQVAEIDGQWLALLGWQAAALMCAPRDAWINWPRPIQFQRLHLIANNCRFLLLPGVRVAHLASRVLGLSLRRLSDDWQRAHGHPVLLAETFVDPERFAGTCYRAANWRLLGRTRGYARHAGRYRHHGQPKMVWVYPLHQHARQRLRGVDPHPDWSQTMHKVKLSTHEMEQLQAHLRALPEPRGGRRQLHRLPCVLTITLAAMLGGARGYLAISEFAARLTQAQRKRLRCYYSHRRQRFEAPSEATIRRVLSQVDAEAVEQAFAAWLDESTPREEALAVDGKTLKGARRPDRRARHLLSALGTEHGTPVAQQEVSGRSNEIPALRHLLAEVELTGKVVTADAMHTQAATARFLVADKGGDYLFTVKTNPPTLHEDCQALDESAFSPGA